jgi:hypothetical protein
MPSVSFLGHLSGLLAGLTYVRGYLNPLLLRPAMTAALESNPLMAPLVRSGAFISGGADASAVPGAGGAVLPLWLSGGGGGGARWWQMPTFARAPAAGAADGTFASGRGRTLGSGGGGGGGGGGMGASSGRGGAGKTAAKPPTHARGGSGGGSTSGGGGGRAFARSLVSSTSAFSGHRSTAVYHLALSSKGAHLKPRSGRLSDPGRRRRVIRRACGGGGSGGCSGGGARRQGEGQG